MSDRIEELLAIERELMRQAERCNSTTTGQQLERVFREAAVKVADLRAREQVNQTQTQDT